MTAFDYDVVIIGSGFGGSVAALRINPIMPRRPLVPPGALGELRLDAKKAAIIPEYLY